MPLHGRMRKRPAGEAAGSDNPVFWPAGEAELVRLCTWAGQSGCEIVRLCVLAGESG